MAIPTNLPGNISTVKKFLASQGTGISANPPAWNILGASDIPNLPATILTSGVVGNQFGGTGFDTTIATNGQTFIGTGTGLALAALTSGPGIQIINGPGTITISGGIITMPSTISYSSTITANVSLTNFVNVIATGDFTFAISGTPGDGQPLTLAVIASGTSSNVTLPSGNFVIPTSLALSSPINVSSSTETLFTFRYKTSIGKWRLISAISGY